MEEVMEQYEISLNMVLADDSQAPRAEEIEEDLSLLITALNERAAGLALGPAGAIHGTNLELVFSVEAVDAAEMYAKLHDIAVILRDTGRVELESTSTRRGDRELAFA